MKWLIKNKNNIFKILIFGIMIYLFILLGTKNYKVEVADNIRFANEYKDISKNNIYVYTNENQVLELLKNKSGILFMGFSSNIWSHYYADYLNEVAINNQIQKIYYYDFYKDRSLNNKTYLSIVNYLKEYLNTSDKGIKDITAPTVVIIKNGKILYYDNEIMNLKGDIKPEEYFSETKKVEIKYNFEMAIKKFLEEV